MKATRSSLLGTVMVVASALSAPRAAPPTVATILGTGVPGYSDTQVNNPYGIIVGPDGALYFCDLDNQRISRFDPTTKKATTIAGSGEKGYSGDGGPAVHAQLGGPMGLAYAPGALFVADTENHVVRRIDLTTGVITTVLGTGVKGDGRETSPLECKLSRPHGLLADGSGTLYVTDSEAHRIRELK